MLEPLKSFFFTLLSILLIDFGLCTFPNLFFFPLGFVTLWGISGLNIDPIILYTIIYKIFPLGSGK